MMEEEKASEMNDRTASNSSSEIYEESRRGSVVLMPL
jgi:hypothetical protein